MFDDDKTYLVFNLMVPERRISYYLGAMKRYTNKWWYSEDPIIIARFQLNEPVLLVRLEKLRQSLETILNRTVHVGELSFDNIKLKEEVFSALDNS